MPSNVYETVAWALKVAQPEQCAPDPVWQWFAVVVIAALVVGLITREN